MPIPTMDASQQPSRHVNDVLRPVSPTKQKRKRSSTGKSKIGQCPICLTRMSTLMLLVHVNRCKPRKPVKPQTKIPSLHLTTTTFASHSFTTTFSATKPNMVHPFTATINLHSFDPSTTLYLHATTPPPHPIPPLPKNTPAARLPLPLLKSALQKAVRRNMAWPALRIAIVLLRRGEVFDLLRRLTVIILEDAILHPAYPFLVFLLASSCKQHDLSHLELLNLLKIVYEVAAVPTSDPLSSLTNNSPPQTYRANDIITALRVRATYGGMECDIDLLDRAANVWHRRSKSEDWQSIFDVYDFKTSAANVTEQCVSPWLRPDDRVLRPGDVPLEAWDFHCCPVVAEMIDQITNGALKGNVPGFQRLSRARDVKGVFEGLMWRFWSSPSHKKPLEPVANVVERRGNTTEQQTPVYHISSLAVGQADSEEQRVWKEELCTPVKKWCKKHGERYGL